MPPWLRHRPRPINGRLRPALLLRGGMIWLVTVTPSTAASRGNGDAVNTRPVSLPSFVVTAERPLLPPESWQYGRIPGFEILSNAPAGTTRRIVREFQRFSQALDIIWFGVQQPSGVPTVLILCGRDNQFSLFQSRDRQPVNRAAVTLTFRDSERSAIILDLQTKLVDMRTPDNPGVGKMEVDAYSQLFRAYIYFLLTDRDTPAPAWFAEGMAQILMAMEVTNTSITVGKVEDPATVPLADALELQLERAEEPETGPTAAAPLPEEDANGPPRPRIQNAIDRQFNAALSRRPLMPMDQLLAVTADSEIVRHPLGTVWPKQAAAFVHWGLYGDNRRHQKAFLAFLQRLRHESLSEELFKSCFNLGYAGMLSELRGYTEFTAHTYAEFRAQKGRELPPPAPVGLRDATAAEIGRIKGDALLLAGLPDLARVTLLSPYVRSDRDPDLLAAFGLEELARGDATRARPLLEAAADGRAIRPRAYLELARLRLADVRAHPAGLAGKLDAAQSKFVIDPLLTARLQPPPQPEVYELIATTWLESSRDLPPENVSVLYEGLRLFPGRLCLMHLTALLDLRTGQIDAARKLIDYALGIAPDDAAKARFAELKSSLPAK